MCSGALLYICFCKISLIYIHPLLSEGDCKSGMQNHFWCVLLSKAFHANTCLDPHASLLVSVQTTYALGDDKTICSDNPYNLKDSYGVLNVTKVWSLIQGDFSTDENKSWSFVQWSIRQWLSLKISAVKSRLNEQTEIESYSLHVDDSNLCQWGVLSNAVYILPMASCL